MDDESAAALRALAGREHGVPERLHGRIAGEDLPSMRRDAETLAGQLGLTSPARERQRGADGRFSSSNDLNRAIRAAAGRP
jgi:hypothetical protein